tara:strand:+ start:3054 stop:4652 length:1599 start_codon:yes stop_codon:yes gene_type:complete
MNSKALALIAGALSGAAAQRQKFKDEYRDKKERQREWMSTYGQRIIKDTETKSSLAIAAAGRLKRAGLEPTSIREIIEKNGVGSLVEMDQEVQQWEKTNEKTFSAEQLNQLYKGTDGWESSTEYSTYEEAIKAAFKAPELTATDTTETEPESWYQSMLGRIRGDDLAEGYDKFLEDDAEGFGGSSIRDVRRMENMPIDTGTEGAAIFDRSAFDTGETTQQEKVDWQLGQTSILRNALEAVTEKFGADASLEVQSVEQFSTTSGVTRKYYDDDQQLRILKNKYPDILKDAILSSAEDGPSMLGNPFAEATFGKTFVENIFNPDNAPTQEEDAPFANVQDELDADLEKKGLDPIDASSLRTIKTEGATDPEKKDFLDRWFSENPGEQYVIADNELFIYDPATDPYKTALPPEDSNQEDIRFTRGEDETQEDYLARIKYEIELASKEGAAGAGARLADNLLKGVDGLLGDLGGFAKQGGAAALAIIPFAAGILQVDENSVVEYLQSLSEAEFEEAGRMIREGAGLIAEVDPERTF